MVNQIVISLGSLLCVWVLFGKRGAAPAIAAGVCGYIYAEVTGLLLGAYLVFAILKREPAMAGSKMSKPNSVDPSFDESNVIDAEFEVKS